MENLFDEGLVVFAPIADENEYFRTFDFTNREGEPTPTPGSEEAGLLPDTLTDDDVYDLEG